MKLTLLTAAVAATAFSPAASSTVCTDPTGDMFDNTHAHLDMTQVEVTNTLTDITFKISTVANPINTPDWGKYQVGIDTNPATGDTNAIGNPWNRRVSHVDHPSVSERRTIRRRPSPEVGMTNRHRPSDPSERRRRRGPDALHRRGLEVGDGVDVEPQPGPVPG